MGALKEEPMPGSQRTSDPPDSRTRLAQSHSTDPQTPAPDPNRSVHTDPAVPAPDPNRTVPTDPCTPAPDPNHRYRPKPPLAAPDSLATPEYIAPTPPPSETEHATFEVQTVKLMELDDSTPDRVGHGLRQADIPTAPSTRVQRRRGWSIGLVLVVLGLVAGLGLLALAKLTRVEPVPAPSRSTPEVVSAPTPIEPTGRPVHVEDLPPATAATPSIPQPPAVTVKPPPPRRTAEPIPPPKATTTGATSSVPLGPPEF